MTNQLHCIFIHLLAAAAGWKHAPNITTCSFNWPNAIIHFHSKWKCAINSICDHTMSLVSMHLMADTMCASIKSNTIEINSYGSGACRHSIFWRSITYTFWQLAVVGIGAELCTNPMRTAFRILINFRSTNEQFSPLSFGCRFFFSIFLITAHVSIVLTSPPNKYEQVIFSWKFKRIAFVVLKMVVERQWSWKTSNEH